MGFADERAPGSASEDETTDPVGLAAAYSELQDLLLASSDVTDFLQQLAVLCAAVVPAAACGITMRGDREAFTVASSHELAREVDEIQYGRGQGPCLQALRTGEPVLVTDLSADDRWPDYARYAIQRGIASSLSLPLTIDGDTVGAINLYGHFYGRVRTAGDQPRRCLHPPGCYRPDDHDPARRAGDPRDAAT